MAWSDDTKTLYQSGDQNNGIQFKQTTVLEASLDASSDMPAYGTTDGVAETGDPDSADDQVIRDVRVKKNWLPGIDLIQVSKVGIRTAS